MTYTERITGDIDKLLAGQVLAVDPGKVLGWALIGAGRELVLDYGELAAESPNTILFLRGLAQQADLLVLEDQYLDRGKKQNPDSVIKLAQITGAIKMLFAQARGLALGENVVLVKAKSWQTCLNLPQTADRKTLKAAAQKQAGFLTSAEDIRENAADAICMGTATVRKMKKIQLLKKVRV